jgi:hypothetical protein
MIIILYLISELIFFIYFYLTWELGLLGPEQWSEFILFYIIVGTIITLIIYIAILILGLSLYYLISDHFRNQQFKTYYKFFSPRLLTVGLLIGLVGIIAQVIYTMFFSLLFFEIIEFNFDPLIEVGSSHSIWLHQIPSFVALFFIHISLILIFLSTINAVPKEILFIPIVKLVRTNIIQLFKISIWFLTIFAVIIFITRTFEPWQIGFRLVEAPFHEQLINHIHRFLRTISILFIPIIFGLISIVFYKIFHVLKFRPPPIQPNLNKGESAFRNS